MINMDRATQRLQNLSEKSCVSEEDLFRAVVLVQEQDGDYDLFLDQMEILSNKLNLEGRIRDGQLYYRGLKK